MHILFQNSVVFRLKVITLSKILLKMALTSAAILGTVGAATRAYSAYKSGQAEDQAQNNLNELYKTPAPRYKVNPRISGLYDQAIGEASNPQGYTGAQTTNFRQQLGQILKSRFTNATSLSGGNSSRAIAGVLGGQETDAINKFAAGNPTNSNRLAALSRAGGYAHDFQSVDNNNTSQDINYRTRVENAYGNTIASQRNYRQNLLTSTGNDLIGTAGYLLPKDALDASEVPTQPFTQQRRGFKRTPYDFSGVNSENDGSPVRIN